MEYLPYKIDAGSNRIKIYQNEFHGLRSFSCIETGKEFLREEAVDVVKYEESGKNAENCVYTIESVVEDVASVKDGLFVEELEDGYALKKKEWAYSWSIYPTITEISHFLLASITRPPKNPQKTAAKKNTQESALIAELESALSEGSEFSLKKTGLFDTLVNPAEPIPQETVITPYEEMFDELYYVPIPQELTPIQRELPVLPALPIRIPKETVETFAAKVRALEYDLQQIDEECERMDQEERILDLEIEEVRKEHQLIREQIQEISESEESDESSSEYSSEVEESSSEYYQISSEEEESSSEEEEISSEEEESSSEEEEISSEEEESSSEEEEISSEEEESSSEEEESSSEEEESTYEEESSSGINDSFWEDSDSWSSEEGMDFGSRSL